MTSVRKDQLGGEEMRQVLRIHMQGTCTMHCSKRIVEREGQSRYSALYLLMVEFSPLLEHPSTPFITSSYHWRGARASPYDYVSFYFSQYGSIT